MKAPIAALLAVIIFSTGMGVGMHKSQPAVEASAIDTPIPEKESRFSPSSLPTPDISESQENQADLKDFSEKLNINYQSFEAPTLLIRLNNKMVSCGAMSISEEKERASFLRKVDFNYAMYYGKAYGLNSMSIGYAVNRILNIPCNRLTPFIADAIKANEDYQLKPIAAWSMADIMKKKADDNKRLIDPFN